MRVLSVEYIEYKNMLRKQMKEGEWQSNVVTGGCLKGGLFTGNGCHGQIHVNFSIIIDDFHMVFSTVFVTHYTGCFPCTLWSHPGSAE